LAAAGQRAGHAYANPGETTLTVANVASLAEEWTGFTEGSLHSEPIVYGGKVFVSDTTWRHVNGGTTGPLARWAGLGALDAGTGATLWTVDISPPMADDHDVDDAPGRGGTGDRRRGGTHDGRAVPTGLRWRRAGHR
jgi:outer membrane protein assembly factor BamB